MHVHVVGVGDVYCCSYCCCCCFYVVVLFGGGGGMHLFFFISIIFSLLFFFQFLFLWGFFWVASLLLMLKATDAVFGNAMVTTWQYSSVTKPLTVCLVAKKGISSLWVNLCNLFDFERLLLRIWHFSYGLSKNGFINMFEVILHFGFVFVVVVFSS